MSYPTISIPLHVGDEAISSTKKSKLIEIYCRMINVKIDRWTIEDDEEKIKKLQDEIFELIDILECV